MRFVANPSSGVNGVMSQGTVNTKSYLDYLCARRAKLDALIQAIEEFDDDGSSQDDPQSAQARPASTGTNREYRGMTIAAATIKFLKSKSEPQLTRTIADALRFGGLGS